MGATDAVVVTEAESGGEVEMLEGEAIEEGKM